MHAILCWIEIVSKKQNCSKNFQAVILISFRKMIDSEAIYKSLQQTKWVASKKIKQKQTAHRMVQKKSKKNSENSKWKGWNKQKTARTIEQVIELLAFFYNKCTINAIIYAMYASFYLIAKQSKSCFIYQFSIIKIKISIWIVKRKTKKIKKKKAIENQKEKKKSKKVSNSCIRIRPSSSYYCSVCMWKKRVKINVNAQKIIFLLFSLSILLYHNVISKNWQNTYKLWYVMPKRQILTLSTIN